MAKRSGSATPAGGGEARRQTVERVSLSLPPSVVADLDAVVRRRGFASRSQAVAEMLYRSMVEDRPEESSDVMVGTITLFYGQLTTGVEQRIADLQRAYIDEVISSFHVHLNENRTLEVLLVQGPAIKLQAIADEMTTVRGVISGRLQMVAAIIPQIHPFIR